VSDRKLLQLSPTLLIPLQKNSLEDVVFGQLIAALGCGFSTLLLCVWTDALKAAAQHQG
jgi:hypothetical protein